MKEDAFQELVTRLRIVPIRLDESPLKSTITKFCKRGQWERVRQLLELAKQKAPYRRAFMNVREATEKHAATYLARHNDDNAGKSLLHDLEEQNRL